MKSDTGNLYWITGLAGAGKTTVGRELCKILKSAGKSVVFLDGDSMREALGAKGLYSREGRTRLALQYSGLCKMLTEQGLNVVCATISMFSECYRWNRRNMPNYHEIYLRVPMNILIKRDSKKMYSRALKGRIRHVMGIDMVFDEPENPDCVVDNDGTHKPRDLAQKIYKHFFDAGEAGG